MSYKKFLPEVVYVERQVADTPVAEKILAALPNAAVNLITDFNDLMRDGESKHKGEPSHTAVLIARQKGPFLKSCPGTRNHICCLYKNINIALNCDLNCAYCILQSYLYNPFITLYANLDDLWRELDTYLHAHSRTVLRVGTGELTDSLTFEHLYNYGSELIQYFKDKKNVLFELKTKSTQIERILGVEHNRRTVISWSVNSEEVISREERQAPSLGDRLIAARAVQEDGYRLGFHFDPMIWYDGWEEGYRSVVERIFSFAKPDNITWISLGALRYPPELELIIRDRHAHSTAVMGELFRGLDGKMRYFKPLRIEMFHEMYRWIRQYSDDIFVYLCMESDEVWRKAFGWSPQSSIGLAKSLDKRVQERK